MRARREMIAAPTGMQPGSYVREAYADRSQPRTPAVDVDITQQDDAWRVTLTWSCPTPVRDVRSDPSLFGDAAALVAPSAPGAQWVTMGAPGIGVDGVLWRADGDALLRVHAEGLGSVKRTPVPEGWTVSSAWDGGRWQVAFALRDWPSLAQQRRIAVAVWRGADAERGGLKSVTPGWIEVAP